MLPFIRNHPPCLHYHAISYRGDGGANHFGHFDTRVEAETFVGDAEMARTYGKLEVVECSQAHLLYQPRGVKP